MPKGIYNRTDRHKPSEITRAKMRIAKLKNPVKYWLGTKGSRLGAKLTEETKLKMREIKLKNPVRYWLGKKRLDITGDKQWKYIDGKASANYYKRLSNAQGKHTKTEWENVKLKHNYTCIGCNKKEPAIKLTKDHIRPLSKGGNNYISNIQPLCKPCNSSKSNKSII